MEVVRQYIDAENLMSIMPLPQSFHNRRLEIIVLQVEEPQANQPPVNVQEIVESLIGSIPPTDLTLAELRQERLAKYEAVD